MAFLQSCPSFSKFCSFLHPASFSWYKKGISIQNSLIGYIFFIHLVLLLTQKCSGLISGSENRIPEGLGRSIQVLGINSNQLCSRQVLGSLYYLFSLLPTRSFYFLQSPAFALIFPGLSLASLLPNSHFQSLSLTLSQHVFLNHFIQSLFQDAAFTFSENNSENLLILSPLKATWKAPSVNGLVLNLMKIYRTKQACSLTLRSCSENEKKWTKLITLLQLSS